MTNKKGIKKQDVHDPGEGDYWFLPLGGCGQFGANFSLYGHNGEWLAVDCGAAFADDRLPGIDVLLPDPTFIGKRRDKLKGLVITHAHEDHIGGAAYLWPLLQCPIYATKFAKWLLEQKFLEQRELWGEDAPAPPKIREIKSGQSFAVSGFQVTPLPVAHSIPEAHALVIETSAGRVVHSGDWNLDRGPVLGPTTEASLFREIGDQGVLAYIGDSTNAAEPGYAGSESQVQQGLEHVFAHEKGRIAITAFASNIGRVQSIARAAQATGRQVGLIGRSLWRMVEAAQRCGYLSGVKFYRDADIMNLPRSEAVLICTGSQGERRAALSKIARDEHPSVELESGDAVVFSSRAIPGNEKTINEVKNALRARHVRIITKGDPPIHVSGHPYQEEIGEMLSWLRPEMVIPVHGEISQQEDHADWVRSCGIKHVFRPQNGQIVALKESGPELAGEIETGLLALDHARIVPLNSQAIRERGALRFDGVAFVTVVMEADGNLASRPRVSTRGVLDESDPEDMELAAELEDDLEAFLENLDLKERQHDQAVADKTRACLRRFLSDVTGLKPKTEVHIIRLHG